MLSARLGAAALLAAAQPVSAADLAPYTLQAPVVVTATRTAQTVDQSLAAVTVITRSDIERSQAVSVPELLARVPGVDVTVSGGLGKVSQVFLRGTNAGHVLVLVDGVPIGSATAGTAALEYLPLGQVQRIEVVRGPRSSLYGSQAIGGIIQIFTREGIGPARPDLAVTGGSLSTRGVTAGVSGARGATHYSLSIEHLATAGFDARQPTAGPFGVDEPDADGFRNTSLSLQVGHEPVRGLRADAQLLRAQGHTEFDGAPNEEDFIQQAAGITLALTPSARWDSKLTLGESRDDRKDLLEGSFFSRFDTRRWYGAWQNDIAVTEQQLLTAGVDYQDEHVSSDTQFTRDSRADLGVFLQDQAALGDHDLLAAVRYDDNEAFGGHTTGSIGYGYRLTESVRFVGSLGTAFKAPTFNDLYFPDTEFFVGNPDLKPERSRSLELALTGALEWGGWELRAYHTEIDDLIAFDAAARTSLNLNRARILGVEGGVSLSLAGWDVNAFATMLDPRDPDTGLRLPRRARSTLQLGVTRDFGATSVAASLLAQGGRFDDVTNTVHVGGYATVDLRLARRLGGAWSVEGRLDNLFDRHYQTVATYNTAGRTALLTVRYAPP